MLVVAAFPALLGSVVVAALSSRLGYKRIAAHVSGVWLTAFLGAFAVTGYLAVSGYYDGNHGDDKIVAVTVGAIFALVTAYVVWIARRVTRSSGPSTAIRPQSA